MWQPQWAATIWKIAGSGVSIKVVSVMKLLSAINRFLYYFFCGFLGQSLKNDYFYSM